MEAKGGKPSTNREKKKLKKKAKFEKEVREIKMRYVDDIEGDKSQAVSQAGLSNEQSSKIDQDYHIDVEGITVMSQKGGFLLNNARLNMKANRRYGLVGRNGLGKTTLLKNMVNKTFRIPARYDMLLCEQEVTADDTPAYEYLIKSDVRRNVLMAQIDILENEQGAVNQAVVNRLTDLYDQLELVGSDSAEARARKILSGLGFTKKRQNQATKEFSGGWRMRLSLARALFIEPTLLLLDEPTNHLDMSAIIWLTDYLQKWDKTLLVVSHDQYFLDNVCTDIIHLDNKKLVNYRGNFDTFKKVFQQKMNEHTRESKSSKKGQQEAVTTTFSDSANIAVKFTFERTISAKHRLFNSGIGCADPYLVQIQGAEFGYTERNPILKIAKFGVLIHTRIAIVGRNGNGKSTFLKLLSGDLPTTAGSVYPERDVLVHRLDQHSMDHLQPDSSPMQYLTDNYDDNCVRVGKVLTACGLEKHTWRQRNSTLSGGQKTKLAFAEIMMKKPDVLLLDEPTNNLDYESIDALVDAINRYNGGVVLVTHDEKLIRETKCELWTIHQKGLLHLKGGFDEYRDNILQKLGLN